MIFLGLHLGEGLSRMGGGDDDGLQGFDENLWDQRTANQYLTLRQ